MRSYSAPELTYLQNRSGYIAKALLWFSARNRATNAVETLGVWTGDDDQAFSIGGVTRTYFGAGAVIGLDPLSYSVGLNVRSQRVRLPSFSPQAQQLILGYDVGLAPAEIHRALFYPESGQLVAEPRRLWKGFVDKAPLPTAAIDGEAPAELVLVSSARALTQGLTLTHSDATQQLRGGDRFLKYATIGGVVKTPWGTTMPAEPQPTPAPTTPSTRERGGR